MKFEIYAGWRRGLKLAIEPGGSMWELAIQGIVIQVQRRPKHWCRVWGVEKDRFDVQVWAGRWHVLVERDWAAEKWSAVQRAARWATEDAAGEAA